ncbi:hypothetical protein Bca52824_009703 [Brassica carinata]|uniref:Response regulatory domain-containing protein n=1 Tax=Brassica carinata TaxID=52824 RepID=A0A8X7WD55_BRACI|nr:hypothetical protein Bca52824_009703 [Brassica carinata]
MSSYTYPLSTNTRFVAADRGTCTPLPCRNNLIYGYVRGLICYFSNSKKFAIYNPTTRQHVLLPPTIVAKHKAFDGFSWYDPVEKHYIVDIKYYHGFFGYDPVKDQYKVLRFIEGPRICDYSCMVITFRGGTSKHEWRNIKIQDDISPPRSNGVCINGIIYYIGGTFPTTSGLVLGRFDVRFERFDHIKIPIDVEMNQLEELSLVNYQGKLGCTLYNKDRAEVWIMKDHHSSEKHEWSKVTIAMSPPYLLKTRIAGVTLNGEIVIMPKTLDSAQMLYAYFYDPRKSKTRRVEFETNLKGEQGVMLPMKMEMVNAPSKFTSPDLLHVLAVDDSHVDRKFIERLLKVSSCKVTVVDSATRALQYLGLDVNEKSVGVKDLKVNLIMTDYSMPGMTGYELLKKIKESSAFRDVPVVVMSSENILPRIDRCLEEGAEDFLLKPVKLSDVRRIRDSLMKVEDLSFTKSVNKRELETEVVYSLDSSVPSQLKRTKI